MGRYINKDGLCDEQIVETLLRLVDDYKNGEILEVKDELEAIAYAIDLFRQRCEESGGAI